MKKDQPFAHAMAFYHADGLPAAWKQAMKFAGKGGRLATMPDIIAARIETKPGEVPWETYFTTTTAEYLGFSKKGNLILIVAHGIGPMSTLDGVQKTYSWEYQDKSRSRRGGRITQQEFWDLEAGKFGEVCVIDFDAYCRAREYPFIGMLRASAALVDPVLKARFGPETEKYVLTHAEHARAWHREQAGLDPENRYNLPDHEQFLERRRFTHRAQGADNSDPFILGLEGASNCSYGNLKYGYRKIEEGYALAHLISVGRLVHSMHDSYESLTFDVSCHEWWNGVRVVGIEAGGNIRSGLHQGPDVSRLIQKHWRDLLVPTGKTDPVGFRMIMKLGNQWFTQCLKQGDCIDNGEPEHLVMSAEKLGKPALFRTTVGGYHGFFKYGIKEVQAIAPAEANAYCFVTDPQIEWQGGNPTHHTAMIQFYRIEADASKRLIRAGNLSHDFDTMMRLVKKETAA